MSPSFFISLRYQKNRNKNPLARLISRFSLLGILLGVAVLVIGLSAMNGFERELNQRVLSVFPHAQITAFDESGKPAVIKNGSILTALLQQNQNIVGVSPFVSLTALLEKGTGLSVVQMKGIDPIWYDRISHLGQFVLNNGWQTFHHEGGLVLGYGIAKSLNVGVGDWVSVLITRQNSEKTFSQPQRYRIKISGILRLDGQLDHNYALMPLNELRQWLGLSEDDIFGVELKVNNPFDVNHIRYPELTHYPQMLSAQNWIEHFGYMYRDIQLIRTIMYIAMVLVIGVACFNIVSTLMMAVKDRQEDIAIMITLGATQGFIRRIFMWYGLFIGMKGCIIGILLGIVTSLNLTELIKIIEHFWGRKLLSEGIYFIDFLPSEFHWQDGVIVFFVAILLSLSASLYPALRASKLSPVAILNGH